MQPKHSRTVQFLQQGLLDDLQSFPQLESRISRLETTNDRGDAFEVFAQGYLATQKIVQAKKVWPFDKIPEEVKQGISISTPKDMGVDGVFETSTGDHCAYQVKFRTHRPSLTWDELSTFMGLTEQASERVLFTNCDDIPTLMNDRERFFCIRGNDLDRLGARDFESIRDWLQTGLFKPIRKTPLLHQEEALHAVQKSLIEADRATLVMACGTGKTLVALWAAERLVVSRVLVLVPSLALVRQTLHEWLKETSWANFSFLCVCSDPTVTRGDELVVHQADLDFPVTTDSSVVREYLSSPYDGVRVVFSTYQSAQVVAEGMGNKPFDLGLFDEAHKTAGREGTRFSFALTDGNLPISKRLFMTATPRHFDVRKKDKEGDARLVYSMDVPDTYGEIAHTLSFRKAATRDIICDYKVVISVVTSGEVNDDLLRRGEVLVQGGAVKARQVANQIALRRAVEQYGVRRIFTFHSSVASARSFTGPGGEGVNSELPEFLAVHVNGKFTAAKREHILQEFSQADKAVISNARCLTEGVDLPAVDMVAFMSPKKSKVDIVQATGRAMRKAENKTFGFVMVPLYVEQEVGESIEESLERTGFGEVWNVLEAMKEQDDVLTDIIRQMREDKGRVGGCDDARFREHVEVLGPSIALSSLRHAITALCVERLGVTWDERYGQLIEYKKLHAHCNVPKRWSNNPKLGLWVFTQRQVKRSGKLSNERIQRLESLGIVWDPYETGWQEMFADLVEYKNQYGHCNVPMRYGPNPSLALWVNVQRGANRKGKITNERIRCLESLGFIWDPLESGWEEMFTALKKYKTQHGHCNVPQSFPANPQLGQWVSRQRRAKRKKEIGNERIERLESLGFAWDKLESVWEEMYSALQEYKNQYGDCNVPEGWSENPRLARWTQAQRQAKRTGEISNERIQRLESLGIVWDPLKDAWEGMFTALKEYKNQYGHCNIPGSFLANPQLGTWVGRQRTAKRKNEISNERIQRLEALGFIWDPLESGWEEMFTALREYKNQHSDLNVPYQWSDNPRLSTWINVQRRMKRKGELAEERMQRLEALGFIWDLLAAAWEEMFAALKEYRNQYGDLNVPQGWSQNPKLSTWINNQRKSKRKGELTEERIQRLEALGFIWDPYESGWEEMFAALKEYRNQYGDLNVPQGWSQNPKLSTWINNQRNAKRKGKLAEERIQRLEALGFIWDPLESGWEEMFAALKEYKNQHGHCNVPYQWPENPELSTWINVQRRTKRKGELSEERIQRLEVLGFIWDPYESGWEEMFTALKEYKNQHGDLNVPYQWSNNPTLWNWINTQRNAKRKDQLSSERTEKLERLGLLWDPHAVAWEEMFSALVEYKNQYRDCNVPQRWSENPKLAGWIQKQRQAKRKGKLNEECIQRLESLGFIWDTLAAAWEEMFTALKEYKAQHGDCNVPQKYSKNRKLGLWVSVQHGNKRRGRLNEERMQRLESLGIVWDQLELAWEKMYSALQEFKNQHAHCNVPQRWSENPRLARWTQAQRQAKRKDKLTEERIQRLEGLGFIWDPFVAAWEAMLTALKEYKNRYGDLNVPYQWSENPKLSTWINNQRNTKRKGELSIERIQRLDALGFIWDPYESGWEEMYSILQQYKNRHGDCNVPNGWSENPKLAGWIQKQRQAKRKGKLNEECIQRLESLGFIWDTLAAAWEEMFTALKEYKAQHGDCNVPYQWSKNPKLWNWTNTQRKAKRKGELSNERIQQLQALGFEWIRR